MTRPARSPGDIDSLLWELTSTCARDALRLDPRGRLDGAVVPMLMRVGWEPASELVAPGGAGLWVLLVSESQDRAVLVVPGALDTGVARDRASACPYIDRVGDVLVTDGSTWIRLTRESKGALRFRGALGGHGLRDLPTVAWRDAQRKVVGNIREARLIETRRIFATASRLSFRSFPDETLAFTVPVALRIGSKLISTDSWTSAVIAAARYCVEARGRLVERAPPWRRRWVSMDPAELYREEPVGLGWWVNTCMEADKACSFVQHLLKSAGVEPDDFDITLEASASGPGA